jgi:hypothetical protein
MVHTIALYSFLGRFLFLDFGMLGFLLLLFTAAIPLSVRWGKPIVPFRWHPRIAKTTIVIIAIHVLLALSVLYNF